VRRQATTVPLFLVDCDRLLSGERHDRVRLLTRFHNFVKDSVNATTWMALGTRANGEVISAESG